jgi:hypothetical protein
MNRLIMQICNFDIRGMNCRGCAAGVQRALEVLGDRTT